MRRFLSSTAAGVLTLSGLALSTAPASAQTICPPAVVQCPIGAPVFVQPRIIRPVVRPVIVRHPIYRHYAVHGRHWSHELHWGHGRHHR
jgi:hypothetical protein